MSDLTLQDFRHLFNERLVQLLSDEKQKMFGEQKFYVKKWGTIVSAQARLSVLLLTSKRPDLTLIPDKERKGGRYVKT
jgi:hypothetical protein